MNKFFCLVFALFFSIAASAQTTEEKMSPKELAKHVSDLIVNKTDFKFEPALQELEQKRVLMVEFDSEKNGTFYARTILKAENIDKQDFGHKFAISHAAGAIEVKLGDKTIYTNQTSDDGLFDYIGYSVFKFQHTTPVELENGKHPLLIKFTPRTPQKNRLYFTFLRTDNNLPDKSLGFRIPSQKKELAMYKYWWVGPLDGQSHESEIMNPDLRPQQLLEQEFRDIDGNPVRWDIPKLHMQKDLPGEHPYQNWHYSTGAFLDAMKQVSEVFPSLNYSEYINKHLDFFLDNRDEIGRMREDYGIIEPAAFGHYYRFSLLDDMGMQTVPYINRLLEDEDNISKSSEEYELAERVSNHMINKAARLTDGTFARFNPDSMVVWADDLYMGSVILLKMNELTGNAKYLDEVINQAKLFDQHLRDEASNLYWHGWFSRKEEPSSSKWARANGWTMMAKTELLLAMPDDHPQRDAILQIFSRHADALLQVQSDDGRWHQVLDDPSTYLETSATAMFVRAFALGVVEGWLSKEDYAQAIEKGWISLTHQVNEKGDVEGIVRGTPIMFADEEYATWPTRKNDPRGLGSVIYAAIAKHTYDAIVNGRGY